MTGAVKKGRQRQASRISTFSGILALIPLTIVFTSSRSDAGRSPASVERRAWVMGTHLTVTVEADDRATAVNASEAALRAAVEVEDRLSTWTDDSELSRLNSAEPDSVSRISSKLESDLRVAAHWWKETRGAFDPGIASLIRAWDLRGAGREPSTEMLASARAVAGLEHLALDRGAARFDTAGFGIEEGGFGKGIALREAADAARKTGADCVVLDFGGQVAIHGDCRELRVDIADPDRRDRRVAVLRVRSGSVATSGNSERGLVVDGELRGHLLDPLTGFPAPDWGSVTVVASDPVAADCLSTALYIMGPIAGGEWLRGRPEIEAVFVERSGEDTTMTATPGLMGRLEFSTGHLTYVQQDPTRIQELTQ
jgi:thiamine biosynthesis lipoprotein